MASSSSQQHLWSDLHRDILLKIFKSLDSPLDIRRFRAVCRPWRSSIPLPPQNPPLLKLPFPITPNPNLSPDHRGHFLLTDSTVYAIQPLTKVSNTTKTWVIKTHPSKSSGCMVLENPLARSLYRDSYPFGDKLTKFLPKALNLLDYKVTEISKVYSLQFVEEGNARDFYFNKFESIYIEQVVVSSKLDKIDGNFAVMALHTAELSVWRMSDKKWVRVTDNREGSYYDSIAYHNGKFYAVDFSGVVISVDPVSLKMTNVRPELPWSNHGRGGQFKSLVESFGDLLLVEKHFRDFADPDCCLDEDGEYVSPIIMTVCKFNERKLEWCHVGDGLKGRSLFVCEDNSFSLLAKDFPGCVENSIYFSDDTWQEEDEDDHPGWEACLFDMEEDTAGPLSRVPGYSKIFWPPPTWLKKNISLSRQLNNLKTF